MTRTIAIVPGPRLGRAAATLAGYRVTVTQWPPRQAGLRCRHCRTCGAAAAAGWELGPGPPLPPSRPVLGLNDGGLARVPAAA